MNIPTEFKLFGQTYTVKHDEKALVNESNAGMAEFRSNEILILPAKNHYGYCRQQREQVFCHELIHCMFAALNIPDLRDNEELVDNLGSLFHQFLETKEGALE